MERLGTLTDRLRRANPLVVDALIAIAVASLAVVEMQGAAESEEGFRDSDGLGALLVLGQTLPLALRGVAPLGSLAFINAAIGMNAALGYDHMQTGTFASLFGVGSAAYLTDNRRAPVASRPLLPWESGFSTRQPVCPTMTTGSSRHLPCSWRAGS